MFYGSSLKVSNSGKKDGTQNYILQINNPTDNMFKGRFGKMVWGIGSVYIHLKKRHPVDINENTLEEREVEKNIGEILGDILKLQNSGREGPKIQPDPEKKPALNSEGSSNKPS